MQDKLISLVAAFIVFCVAFRVLDWTRPRERRLPLVRREFWTDLAYWFFTPTIGEVVKRAVLLVVIVPVALVIWRTVDMNLIMHGFGPASRLPPAVQVLLMLLIGDFIGYWMHRYFHRGRAWRFHAVHHSSVDLDWLSSLRQHTVNEAAMAVAGTTPILLLGFAPVHYAAVAPIIVVLSVLIHANVDWDWGPLRWMLASPRFHRWHHSNEPDARDKNFAGVFPLRDVLFGTYFMPAGRIPSAFGTDTPIPNGLWRQLTFPFSKH